MSSTEHHPAHFLLISFSDIGHLKPMLSLASQLVSLGCRVTFVKTGVDPRTQSEAARSATHDSEAPAASQAAVKSSAPCSPKNEVTAQERLRFVTLPAVRNYNSVTEHEILKSRVADRQDLVASILEESAPPITCIICDLYVWKWVRHVARAHRLRCAVLSVVGALTFYTFYLSAIGKVEELDEMRVSQFGMPSKKDAMAYKGLPNMNDSSKPSLQKLKFFFSLLEDIEEADTILINSFEALEAPLLPSLHVSCFDVRFIGPCLPLWHKDDGSLGNSMAQQAGIRFSEDETCLTWLDHQEKGSVLFVSFGSHWDVDAKQIEEIEMGIKESAYKFLWVVRPNALARPKHGLSEQINGQEKGMFVAWAPQIKVLQHLAVGGFLTHSGWNSTLESVTFGVPMLCLPIFGEQTCAANLVHYYLKVGIRLSISTDGLVHREDVASGVQAIMQGQFSQTVRKLRELAQLAIQEGYHNLSSFVQDMK